VDAFLAVEHVWREVQRELTEPAWVAGPVKSSV
jgi:hypothetical protein